MTANVTYNSGDRFEMLEAAFPAGTMRYLTGGEGHPVLYLHGAGGLRVTPALHLLAGSGFRLYLPILSTATQAVDQAGQTIGRSDR